MGKVALAVLLGIGASGAAAEEVTLLAFGDSLTQGYGLPVDDGFVPQLENWLTAQGRAVRVINGGVSGDTTAGGLARAAWSLTPDVDAMILTLGGNDMLRGIDPAVSRANLAGILDAAAGVPVLLVGMTAPGNYGPDYKAAFDAMYPELAAQYDTLLFPTFFARITDSGQDIITYMQPDGIHPSAEGVALIVDALGPSVLDLIDRVE
ncbi:GDSL family lipase [Pseudaestuariivita atlantica]|uniref:GDSL family lipase n=2 Tax=Pseudaestuariivita atlantica TaxID=1317121 RepID=A0A0L1JR39_9RHOB|nr:arylesterase [Pseudaestuariivita atlantica]KNG94206.1 GDSL family lipase [Pseudaestuariivita atlantica]